jgi:hypothetical protein
MKAHHPKRGADDAFLDFETENVEGALLKLLTAKRKN